MSLDLGQIIEGKYRIVRLLGEGGMGSVYEGENIRINRRVAIKVLHAGFTENSEVTQRFQREAQAAGRIGNDHILEVLDLGWLPSGDSFIVMEYLDGEPLTTCMERERLKPAELAPLVRQVLVGLAAAHEAGIVHRDLKPDNIFILKSKAGHADFVKIIDFGISKFQPQAGDGMRMTRTGAVMGTPYYMSPEQASGSTDADARSDLYSLGVVMFEAVTGQVPFVGATFNQLMFKIVLSDVPTPESLVPDLDPAFASLISRALTRDVNARFQSARDFMRAIDEWIAHGAAVSVPPATAQRPSHELIPADARGALAGVINLPALPRVTDMGEPHATPAGVRTNGTWTSSHVDDVRLMKRSRGAVGLLATLAVVVLAGGAAYAFLGSKKDAPAVVAAPTTLAVPALPVHADPAPVQALPSVAIQPTVVPAASAEAAANARSGALPVPSATAEVPPSVAPKTAVKPVHHSNATKQSSKSGAAPDFGY